MRSMLIPRRSHHTDSLLRPKKALVLAKASGTPTVHPPLGLVR
jgi:hypothetical protein